MRAVPGSHLFLMAHLLAHNEHVSGQKAKVCPEAFQPFHHLTVIKKTPGRKLIGLRNYLRALLCLELSIGITYQRDAMTFHLVKKKVSLRAFARLPAAKNEGQTSLDLAFLYTFLNRFKKLAGAWAAPCRKPTYPIQPLPLEILFYIGHCSGDMY